MQFYNKKNIHDQNKETRPHFTLQWISVKQTVTENSEHDSECTYLNMYSTVTPQIMSVIVRNTVLQSRKLNHTVDNQGSVPWSVYHTLRYFNFIQVYDSKIISPNQQTTTVITGLVSGSSEVKSWK